MRTRLVTLLTDFGLRDPYVGIMKGVILAGHRETTLVDLTHDLEPQDIDAAAFYLRASWSWFPPATIHLVVVDPGVGTSRRMILAEAWGHLFVAPDNGVLTAALGVGDVKYREIKPRDWHGRTSSATFHGRDYFAPTTGFLAAGGAPRELGDPIDDPVSRTLEEPPPSGPNGCAEARGRVIVIDRFGNLITNFGGAWLDGEFEVAGHRVARSGRTFADAPAGELMALVGSFGYVELVSNGRSAATEVGARPGATVTWRPRNAGE